MTEKCFDIGTIQAFLDGELAVDRLETVSRHIAICDGCAIMLAEAEEESAFAFSALEQEFNTFVPTNRLWTKINDSIEKEKKPFWQTVFARFSNPSVAAFASLVIVVGLFAVMFIKTDDGNKFVAVNNPDKQIATSQISKAALPLDAQVEPKVRDTESIKGSSPDDDKNKPRFVKAVLFEKENSRQPVKSQKPNTVINQNVKPSVEAESSSNDANLLGEESYVKTIATLTKTVNSSKDEVLKPSARFAFERDLAVTNDAIQKMRAEVKKNPKNEAAKEVLRASYQNKIDLLSSVAEKSELMASIK
jgi:hypothetical protein